MLIEIPQTRPLSGRRLVIPDIHGCGNTLEELLSVVGLTKQDYLFFLGDYIDRGDKSSQVIQKIINLQNSGFQVFPLRGNHEQMFIDEVHEAKIAEDYRPLLRYCIQNNTLDLLDDAGKAIFDYVDWMIALPYYYELDTCFLVHAGFNFAKENPFEDTYAMLWLRGMKPDREKLKGKFVVHGHTPTFLPKIKEDIANRASCINLDNGCVYKSYEYQLGHLLCLDIDSFELYMQACID